MIAILLVGFNRPQATIKSIVRIQKICREIKNCNLVVSIDGPRKANIADHGNQRKFDLFFKDLLELESFQVLRHKRNLGVDLHIPKTLTQIFRDFEGILVIEDDIEFSDATIFSMLVRLKESIKKRELSPILGMSGIKIPVSTNLRIQPKWRYSIYFSAWGYALTRNFWEKHQERLFSQNSYVIGSLDTKNWSYLSHRQKTIWSERLIRKNYDYQIQRTMFELDINSIAPNLRITHNAGFDDSKATNTRFSTPRYMKSRYLDHYVMSHEIGVRENSLQTRFLRFIDSNTWAGDGLLSKRGRTVGLRTTLNTVVGYFKRLRLPH